MTDLDVLLPRPMRGIGVYVWATVTQASPLRIQLDGDSSELGSTPQALVADLAVDDRVWVHIVGRRLVVVGRADGSPHPVTLPQVQALAAAPNPIINGALQVNQRGYVSGANLDTDDYGHDRWKATTDGTSYTFTQADTGCVLTLAAGGQLAQVIEEANVPAGSWTFGHDGTAQMRVYHAGDAAPAFADGPVAFTSDGDDDVVVEFSGGAGGATISKVRGTPGSTLGDYPHEAVDDVLRRCKFYFRRELVAQYGAFVSGFQVSTVAADVVFIFDAPMRVTPTATLSANVRWSDRNSFDKTPTSFTFIDYQEGANRYSARVNWSGGAGATYRPGQLYTNNAAGAHIDFDAEM